jgi:hypothetical protein
MGKDEDSVSSVGSSDSRSRNKHRLDGVSKTLKVSADPLDGEGLSQFVSVKSVTLSEQSGIASQRSEYPSFDHSGDSSNILTNDPSGPDFVNNPEHLRPEITLVLSSPSLSSIGKRLAGESPREYINLSSPLSEICLCNVLITLRFWEPIFKDCTAKGINLAMENIVPSEHGSGHLRPSDPTK